VREGQVLYVHASPRRPINEYIFPEDVFTNPQKVISNFERLDTQLCFLGHTHQPGVFLDDPYFDAPNELPDSPYWEVEDTERAIINVGSVGQPRDKDPRASYVVVHGRGGDNGNGGTAPSKSGGKSSTGKSTGTVLRPATWEIDELEFVRLEYDVEATVRKILAEPMLDDMLGHRLYEGR